MKICFVWIDKFRNFENLGVNLSSSVKFSYDISSNKLHKKKIASLPDNFFGESIIDVVGLIGKNGAGKSNAVELVCKILKGGRTSLQGDFFIVTEDGGDYTCYHSYTSRSIPLVNFDIAFEDYSGSINPLKVVFFSNVFDDRRNDFDKEVSDISVNNSFGKVLFNKRERLSDFEKQIKLINTKIFRELNIELPKKVQLTSKVWTNRFNSSIERDIYRDNFEKIREFKAKFRERLRDIKPENKFIHLFRFGFFFEIYHNYSRRSGYRRESRPLFRGIGKVISNLDELRTTEEITEKLITYLEEEVLKSNSEQMNLFMERYDTRTGEPKVDKIIKQIDFIKNVKRSIGKMNIEYNSEGSRNRGQEYFTFDFKLRGSNNFINEFISLFGDSSVFDINWLGISSGHKAYLNLFASLYQELKKTRQPYLLLCIDEGDLYLHPKWQIEFFDKLMSVLPIIFSGKVQLILTSHSPFLLSDLPNQNVTILDKTIEGSTIDGVDLMKNTFGGNLYDLYSEPFFLGNKRISDFAYNKIKSLIDTVEGKEFIKQDKIELQKLVAILGDEVLQFRIKKLLNDD